MFYFDLRALQLESLKVRAIERSLVRIPLGFVLLSIAALLYLWTIFKLVPTRRCCSADKSIKAFKNVCLPVAMLPGVMQSLSANNVPNKNSSF